MTDLAYNVKLDIADVGALRLALLTYRASCEAEARTMDDWAREREGELADKCLANANASRSFARRAGELLEKLELGKLERVTAPPATRVLVALEGGCVQGIIADRADVHAVVIDYDTEGAEPADLFDIPQSDRTTAEAYRSDWGECESDAAFIAGAMAAPCVADSEDDAALVVARNGRFD